MNDLLKLIDTIHNLMKKVLFLKKTFLFFLTEKTNKEIKTYFQMVQENILKILKNLKSKLEIEISIQEKKLKQAKSEVNKNLT